VVCIALEVFFQLLKTVHMHLEMLVA